MNIYSYEAAFNRADITTAAMRKAIEQWFSLYYGANADAQMDSCQRIGYTVVNKLNKTVFGEYRATADDAQTNALLQALEQVRKQAFGQAMVGGECYLKPYPEKNGFRFTLIPRNHMLIFGRTADGTPTDVGTVEVCAQDNQYYTLLERRQMDGNGYLTIENRLYRSGSSQSLGSPVPLTDCPQYAHLMERYTYTKPIHSVGLVRLKTPMVNCVDGSADGVSIYGAAAGLIENIDRNEAQMNGEFSRGQSRILASADLLRSTAGGGKELTDHLFVGLDEDPEQVGITIFSPQLREDAYLARKQEYLRNVESIIGLRRGMLSDANVEERTATEIASSVSDFQLTVLELQQMWTDAVKQTVQLCAKLAQLYRLPVPQTDRLCIDWGNGVLYDEEKIMQSNLALVQAGLLKPELALGWRFGLEVETPEQIEAVRRKFMP